MKKLIVLLFVIGVGLVTISMFGKRAKVETPTKSLIENSRLGYSDIPEDNGL